MFCVCPTPGSGVPALYVVVLLVFSEWRWEVIVSFDDIGGIVDHHMLNFLFIILIFFQVWNNLTIIYDST